VGFGSNALAWLGFGIKPDTTAVTLPGNPWQTGSLTSILYPDIFPTDPELLTPTRDDAMSLAPVGRGRNLITGAIASTPLRVFLEGETEPFGIEATPWWLNHTDGPLSAYWRMTWTLDDGLFYGESLWLVERDGDGAIATAAHVPYATWEVTATGQLEINGEPVHPDNVVYFPFHVEGFLVRGRRTLRMALAVERGVQARAEHPIPLMVMQPISEDYQKAPEEAAAYVDAMRAARRKGNGGAMMYVPFGQKLEAYGERADSGHAIEARNALRLDFANHIGVAGSRLDGSTAESSLTYTTQEGDQQELASATGLGPWMDDITARLSQPDVMAPGVAVRFERPELLTPNPDPIDTGAEKTVQDPAPVSVDPLVDGVNP
jgi:hypothetical protein